MHVRLNTLLLLISPLLLMIAAAYVQSNWLTSDVCEERASGPRNRKETHMELGMIGSRRMGTNIARRLLRATFADKVLSALGGHEQKAAARKGVA
jgi:hypothetical protein